ncbi:MAG TPA: hypothetical protein VGS10_19645 [Terracidiphilus sp.]|nr:hypothetical protein [Terracidiphilus sp.]
MEHRPELDTIGSILASEEALAPSSGFVSAVMERLQEESRVPPPIPFPWKRAIPGMVLAGGVFGWGAFEMMRHASAISIPPVFFQLSATATSHLETIGWVVLALAASMLVWRFSCRLVGRAGLF